MNKKTLALTKEQYKDIITTMKSGFCGMRANERVAMALVHEANIGIRISDIVKLKLSDIVKDVNRYRLDITEQKTKKTRTFTVPFQIYQYIENYCLRNGIAENQIILNKTERAVQKQLKIVCDYLNYDGISTHSFRKFFATEIYKNNNYNIALVQQLLQHSSTAITQRYIGIQQKELEQAIESHICLI